MRRPLVALAVLSCLGLPACADGPTQTFNPISGNPSNQNDGNSPGMPSTTPGSFQQQSGGENQMVLCSADKTQKVWSQMVNAPLKPPRYIGLIDLAGGDKWPGLTIEEAEKFQCQSTNLGDAFGDGSQYNVWGDGEEVGCDYNVSNHKIFFCNAWGPGYVGTTDFTSRDGAHKYSVAVSGIPIQKDGQNFLLDWVKPDFNQDPAFDAEINELYDALTATYAPGLPQNNNCQGSGSCIVGNFGDVAYMFFPALGVGWWIASLSGGNPEASSIIRIDDYLTKTMPYSLANSILKLDQSGPLGLAGTLGSGTSPCTLRLGLDFGTFNNTCVQVDGNPASNQTELNKLLGGLTHDEETWSFDVQGIDIQFKDGHLAPTAIVTDQDMPQASDLSRTFDIDQSTLGVLNNDFTNNDPTQPQDWHGAGLVYLEYARIVQRTLNQFIVAAGGTPHALGDPACLGGTPAAGCTGFEGFVTTAPLPASGSVVDCTFVQDPTDPAYDPNCVDGPGTDNLALGWQALYVNGGLALGLKPGHPKATFCQDANGNLQVDPNSGTLLLTSGYQNCPNPPNGTGDLMSTSYAQVLHVMGKDKVTNLPPDVQDVRFFWKAYAQALVKYFEVASTANGTGLGPHENATDIDAYNPKTGVPLYSPTYDDDFFFDSEGSGQFEIAEYVDRRFASTTQGPTDIVFSADVKNGIFDNYTFSRALYRGETAIYSAVLANQSDGLGQERNAVLTNVFGSPLLASAWTDVLDANGGLVHSAYYCATNYDPQGCQGQLPPLNADGSMQVDSVGNPRLTNYQAAFGHSSTSFTLGQSPQPIKVIQTFDDIQQATVSVPLYQTYYDPNSATLPPLSTLIPWTPKQPGIGFPVALSGTLDKFIETSNLDFSGTTISASVDYDVAIDPMTQMPATDGSITFKAVETTDFLGEVFVCQAPSPTIPGTQDLLGVRMYTPVASILDWLAKHPGSYTSCGIIIRYSPYDNYADYITSLTNGVRLSITQGGGFGRVVDVTLFVPGQ